MNMSFPFRLHPRHTVIAIAGLCSFASLLAARGPATEPQAVDPQLLAERNKFIVAAMEEERNRVQAAAAAADRTNKPEMRNGQGTFSQPSLNVPINALGWFKDMRIYYVQTGVIQWSPNPGQLFQPVNAPRGFVTDLASIPRILWVAFRPEGAYAYAAVVHDYLYWVQDRPREEADEIFKTAMEDSEVGWVIKEAVYLAVRSPFGQMAWNQNRRLKKSGERRFLKRFPGDFRTTWEEWKKEPDVFVDGIDPFWSG
jgi:hypothetical protein